MEASMLTKIYKSYFVIFFIGIIFPTSIYSAEEMGTEGKWNKPGIPHRGWTHEGVEDLKDITGVCEMCDKTRIRYLHNVSHDEYDNLTVGRDCAEKMCNDYENPKKREAATKKANRQREIQERREIERLNQIRRDWLDLTKWRTTSKGGYSRKIGHEWVNVFQKDQNWKYVFQNQFSGSYINLQAAIQGTYDQYINK